MRGRLLESLSNLCLRNTSKVVGCKAALASTELCAAQLNTLTRSFRAETVTGICLPGARACWTGAEQRHDNASLLSQPKQLLSLKGFATSAANGQDTAAPAAGINPLMQTPAPAASTSLFTPEAAATQANRTAQAVLRKTKISPKKLNEFARLIRRMHIDDALVQCQVAPNKAAKLCYKLLLSARDNAEKDKGLDPEKLRVDRAFVGKGQNFKRLNTHARGRSGTRLVYHAHLTIILAEGSLKRVTQFRPPNAQWNKNRRSSLLPVA